MKRLIMYLPVLILLAFPILYINGHGSSEAGAGLGLGLLLLGLSTSIFRRFLLGGKEGK